MRVFISTPIKQPGVTWRLRIISTSSGGQSPSQSLAADAGNSRLKVPVLISNSRCVSFGTWKIHYWAGAVDSEICSAVHSHLADKWPCETFYLGAFNSPSSARHEGVHIREICLQTRRDTCWAQEPPMTVLAQASVPLDTQRKVSPWDCEQAICQKET